MPKTVDNKEGTARSRCMNVWVAEKCLHALDHTLQCLVQLCILFWYSVIPTSYFRFSHLFHSFVLSHRHHRWLPGLVGRHCIWLFLPSTNVVLLV